MQIARRGQSLAKSSVVRHSKIGLPISQLGPQADLTLFFGDVRFTLDKRTSSATVGKSA
jgi:hypothetical protein